MEKNGRFGVGRKGGRPKGTPNKLTQDVKAAILEAFDNAGGVAYLCRIADEHPQVFCSLLGKVLPTQVTGADGGPIVSKTVVELVRPTH